MLTKQNVCVYIKDEEHLEEMREFLIVKGEKIDNDLWFCLDESVNLNYLQLPETNIWWLASCKHLTEVTTEQFKKLWE